MWIRVAVLSVCVLVAGACSGAGSSANPPDGDGEGEGAGDGGGAGTGPRSVDDAGAIAAHEQVGTELPTELIAELRQQGDDANGRLLTLAPGFVATAACSDCGAPSYLRFIAVRCEDPHHCEVLTEQCEGKVSREASVYVVEFRAVEGADEEGAELCAGYSGSFEPT
ncbi:hypothetical protein DB30_02981 [Enhygromyxa salina]|uniref:Lipoprotein n=1 Tax=Enhygromyxa salina TaxID=215803 RepID=A0A0C2D3D0_9BACT|nr:hypothetical protein [Enhygromyxa salina]KIG17706.1 hypothetical protein DB30_02981 [Enhygromyxa salina]